MKKMKHSMKYGSETKQAEMEKKYEMLSDL